MRVFMFPGQGSQYVGMGRAAYEASPAAKKVFSVGEEITGLPLRRLCFEGPLEELTRTINLQPALTAVDLAILAALEEKGFSCEMVCGHSLGEYPALYAAGVLTLEEVFYLVLKRGELMEEASHRFPGAMFAVIGLLRDQLESLAEKVQREGVVSLANHNAPDQIVITGEEKAVSRLAELAKEAGARVVRLKVSGAYHSPLMAEAAEKFREILKEVPFSPPKKKFFSNVSATEVKDPEELRYLMGKQMESPVRFVEEIQAIHASGGREFWEVGPKKVLMNLVKKILKDEEIELQAVEDPQTLQA